MTLLATEPATIPLPTIDGVRRALSEIRPFQPETPLVQSVLLSEAFGAEVWLKNETVSPIGCFKLRGALVDLLRATSGKTRRRIVTSSSGNHGQGVAYAGRILGLAVTVFLPSTANAIKRATIYALGAEIRLVPGDSYSVKLEAQRYALDNDCYFVDDGDCINLAEGAGTVGLEIADALESIDAVFLPVGDAALINGAGSALKAICPYVEIIGVQALGAPAYAYSHRSGAAVDYPVKTIADGLATRKPTPSALNGMKAFVDRFVLVEENEMLSAIHSLAIAGHILAEPSGAATLAAAWKDRHQWSGKKIALVVSGSNIEPQVLVQAVQATPLWPLPKNPV
ncbi:pyridoxal-phosphate dependent enzyme [Bradyrhizobium sp. INPA03-11B]|uniref:threonine ammonia-lyase n=1 Tax=Bradyrhizobium sp. INPA03-11B TaxID=418598 RepID=UPI00338D4EF4